MACAGIISQLLSPGTGLLPPGANHVRLQVIGAATRARGDESGSGGARVFCTDVSEAQFEAMLQRAARHPGYTPRRDRHKATLWRDLQMIDRGGGDQTVSSRAVLGCSPLPGAPVVALISEDTPLPLAAFPCDALPHDVRDVSMVSLRVHAHARLVFAVHRGLDHPQGAAVRTVCLEVDLRPFVTHHHGRQAGRRAQSLAADMNDLARTVENTVQVVLMGAPPVRRAFAHGHGHGHGHAHATRVARA